jgi:hypothetical protein
MFQAEVVEKNETHFACQNTSSISLVILETTKQKRGDSPELLRRKSIFWGVTSRSNIRITRVLRRINADSSETQVNLIFTTLRTSLMRPIRSTEPIAE